MREAVAWTRSLFLLRTALLYNLLGGSKGITAWQTVTPRLSLSDQPYLYFVSYHKSGTALVNHACDHLKHVLTGNSSGCSRCTWFLNHSSAGEYCLWALGPSRQAASQKNSPNGSWFLNHSSAGEYCLWDWSDGIHKEKRVVSYPPSERFYAGAAIPDIIARNPPSYKGVVVIRDPLTQIASTYIYDQTGQDHTGVGGEELARMSLEQGLIMKAQEYADLALFMHNCHEAVLQHPHNFLEVKFEDFQRDYDGTTSKIFRYFTDNGHPELEQRFVELARADDISRWPPERRMNAGNHISNPDEERKVVEVLKKLCRNNEPSVLQALARRPELGYGPPCPTE